MKTPTGLLTARAKLTFLVTMLIASIAGAGTSAAALARGQSAPESSRSSQTTLYVSTQGLDSPGCGRLAHACATIGYALGQASAGDRILVEPGVYLESENPGGAPNVIAPSLTGVTLAADRAHGANPANTVIDATGESQGIVIQANGATVEGLTVENAQLQGILARRSPAAGPPAEQLPRRTSQG